MNVRGSDDWIAPRYSSFRCRGPVINARSAADMTEAIRLNANDPRPYFFRGYAYQRLKDYDRAIADFNDAIRLHPKAATYYYQRGKAYEAKGDQEHANADFEQAKRLGP